MIYFILARSNSHTIKNYLEFRGKSLVGFVGIIYYDNLLKINNLKFSTLIFSDFDRLTAEQLDIVSRLFNKLKREFPKVNLINDPNRVKLRYNLLRALSTSGQNNYNIYRLSESLNEIRFPVFLREENNHTGSLSDLIYDLKSLDKNILALKLQGYPAKSLLVVEFINVETSDGVFKKYSALKIKDIIIPRQLDYNMHWMVKTNIRFNTYPEKEYFEELELFMQKNPHSGWLKQIFEIAGIEYGRIDYGIFEGVPIVWEINLNPDYGSCKKRRNRKGRDPVVEKIRGDFHEQLKDKIIELNNPIDVKIQLEISEQSLRIMQPQRSVENWRKFHNLFNTKKPFFKKLAKYLRKTVLIIAQIFIFISKPFGYTSIRIK